eukprot:Mrub_09190.p1 GENE.Mrub_09190~~Mrub_09190.p1  ORF type:complete len:215 (+),score=19.30 Mrub_09190:92-646(+)
MNIYLDLTQDYTSLEKKLKKYLNKHCRNNNYEYVNRQLKNNKLPNTPSSCQKKSFNDNEHLQYIKSTVKNKLNKSEPMLNPILYNSQVSTCSSVNDMCNTSMNSLTLESISSNPLLDNSNDDITEFDFKDKCIKHLNKRSFTEVYFEDDRAFEDKINYITNYICKNKGYTKNNKVQLKSGNKIY